FYLSNRPDARDRPAKAYDPTPAHNNNNILYSVLSWEPGLIAIAHNVWLGTSKSNLSLIAHSLPRNECTLFYESGFEPGMTYYWRVDEITSIQTTVTGDLWTFSVPGDQAFIPYPEDGQIQVIENHLTLTWAPGRRAIWHDVYFSENLIHVQNENLQAHQGRSTRSEFTPTVLKGQTTYYWRVNEIELDGQSRHLGPVWSFTTMPSIPVLDSNLRAIWTWDEGQGVTAADTSGFRHHAQIQGDPLWVNGVLGTAIELDGIDDYAIASGENLPAGDSEFTVSAWIHPYVHSHTLLAWGSPQANRAHEIRLTQGNLCQHSFWGNYATFDTGSLANEWHHLVIGFDGFERKAYVDGAEVPPVSSSDTSEIPNVSAGDVVLGANPWVSHDKYHGLLDEVRIYNVGLQTQAIQDLYLRAQWQASQPFPKDKTAIDMLSHLSWEAQGSDLVFDVYFGQDAGWVRTASTSDQSGTYLGPFDDPYADIALPSATQDTYFWRVDTRSGDVTIKGHVWSFQTVKSFMIDDFETYTENSPHRLYQTWVDGGGFTDPPPGQPGNGSGAIVGYEGAPFTENSVVYSGYQAMPLRFQNANPPYYSEATRIFNVRKDWVSLDYQSLCLSFFGPQSNQTFPSEFLYVTLTDSQGNSDTIQHSGPVSLFNDVQWHSWHIPMDGFVSVDLSDIKDMSIGMGDRSAAGAGSQGILYIDAVRLTSAP
ncbi:MAG: LamG domain-containing protein, partial [Phycisphaeraceae bacterium]|nr:LamG domain-containing protein [Phycisphaeraceae bacterium]